MTVKDPHYAARVRQLFNQARFIQDLGIELDDLAPGRTETSLRVFPRHEQQNGYIHAGVLATLADHAAGGAAGTLVGPDEIVLTAEFKINFLRAARGVRLTCTAKVLKPGRMLIFAESEVYAHAEAAPLLVAKAMVTLAVLQREA